MLAVRRLMRSCASGAGRACARGFAAVVSPTSLVSATLGLSPADAEFAAAAADFAAAEFAPHAAGWHARHEFPEKALRAAAAAGLAGLCVRPEHGGTGLSRLATIPVIEALAAADTSTTAYLTIHNMVATLVDLHAPAALRDAVLPSLLSMDSNLERLQMPLMQEFRASSITGLSRWTVRAHWKSACPRLARR